MSDRRDEMHEAPTEPSVNLTMTGRELQVAFGFAAIGVACLNEDEAQFSAAVTFMVQHVRPDADEWRALGQKIQAAVAATGGTVINLRRAGVMATGTTSKSDLAS